MWDTDRDHSGRRALGGVERDVEPAETNEDDRANRPRWPPVRGAALPLNAGTASIGLQNGTQPIGVAPSCSFLVAATRRSFDLVVAAVLLMALAPLLLLVALAIRIDSPGQVLFRQRRLGRGRQPFTVYKFRTMVADGDRGLHREYVGQLIAGDDAARSNGGALFKPAMDDYITGVGRFLRHSSVDEIPQLWNVLIGEMSLIGPRPVIEYEAALYPRTWDLRFAVKPGLTGLWQVSGRNRLTYVQMIDLDLEYVRRRSLRLDAAILARTIPAVLLRRGVS